MTDKFIMWTLVFISWGCYLIWGLLMIKHRRGTVPKVEIANAPLSIMDCPVELKYMKNHCGNHCGNCGKKFTDTIIRDKNMKGEDGNRVILYCRKCADEIRHKFFDHE